MGKTFIMDHPLIQHKIGIIRRKETGTKDFRQLISEIAMLITYEATRNLELADQEIETPICKTTVKELGGKKLAIVPILRAGLGMVDGMLAMIPSAKVGHIGLYRDPVTALPHEYYCKLPEDCDKRNVFVVDPMLATGGSAIAAIQMLKEKGVKNITLMCIIAAPEGVKAMEEAHPDVNMYIGALDEKLNEKFMQTKMYEKYVKSFVEKGGMTLKAKLCLTVPVSLLLLFMFITIENTMMRMIIIIMWLAKVIVFTRMKTIKVETNREAYDGQ